MVDVLAGTKAYLDDGSSTPPDLRYVAQEPPATRGSA